MEYFSKLLRGGVLLQIGINTDAMWPVLEKNKEQKLINIELIFPKRNQILLTMEDLLK